MALTQIERIEISSKQITIPLAQQDVVSVKASVQAQILKAQQSDDTNKSLMDNITSYIDVYQLEVSRYTGEGRTTIIEQDMLDSANKIKQNPFFPNDNQFAIPSLPDGVWKNFVPFSKGKAIGKNYSEVFLSTPNESAKIIAINAVISNIEAHTAQTRSSGDDCTLGIGANPDVIAPNTSMTSLAADLNAKIIDLNSFVIGTKSSVPIIFQTTTQQSENIASKADVDIIVGIISTWSNYPDFVNINETTCPLFDTTDVTTLPPSKFRASELLPLKTAIANRLSFSVTRLSQINGHLGNITVDGKGRITAVSGWYGDRFRIVDMRLNIIAGTLSNVIALQGSINAQDETTASLDNQISVYNTILSTTLLRAPASGGNVIHVIDGAIFTVNDTVFIVSDGKSEISATINSISGNTLSLSSNIPKSYIPDNVGRVYKVI